MTHHTKSVQVYRVHALDAILEETDQLAIEEPLEIRLDYTVDGKPTHRAVSLTMRTPGHDDELAVGFLYTEGIIRAREDVIAVAPCGLPDPETGETNTVRVDLAPHVTPDLKKMERHFYTTSSCGVCGKASLDALETGVTRPLPREGLTLTPDIVHRLPQTLRAAQEVFDRTGGLHASALYDAAGDLLALREDVGRHNALDKVIGAEFLADRLPLSERILLVSGRASFELVQKAVAAGIPVMAAVGAPSSLAVEMAERFGMTLLGFVRDGRFNIYAGEWRIVE